MLPHPRAHVFPSVGEMLREHAQRPAVWRDRKRRQPDGALVRIPDAPGHVFMAWPRAEDVCAGWQRARADAVLRWVRQGPRAEAVHALEGLRAHETLARLRAALPDPPAGPWRQVPWPDREPLPVQRGGAWARVLNPPVVYAGPLADAPESPPLAPPPDDLRRALAAVATDAFAGAPVRAQWTAPVALAWVDAHTELALDPDAEPAPYGSAPARLGPHARLVPVRAHEDADAALADAQAVRAAQPPAARRYIVGALYADGARAALFDDACWPAALLLRPGGWTRAPPGAADLLEQPQTLERLAYGRVALAVEQLWDAAAATWALGSFPGALPAPADAARAVAFAASLPLPAGAPLYAHARGGWRLTPARADAEPVAHVATGGTRAAVGAAAGVVARAATRMEDDRLAVGPPPGAHAGPRVARAALLLLDLEDSAPPRDAAVGLARDAAGALAAVREGAVREGPPREERSLAAAVLARDASRRCTLYQLLYGLAATGAASRAFHADDRGGGSLSQEPPARVVVWGDRARVEDGPEESLTEAGRRLMWHARRPSVEVRARPPQAALQSLQWLLSSQRADTREARAAWLLYSGDALVSPREMRQAPPVPWNAARVSMTTALLGVAFAQRALGWASARMLPSLAREVCAVDDVATARALLRVQPEARAVLAGYALHMGSAAVLGAVAGAEPDPAALLAAWEQNPVVVAAHGSAFERALARNAAAAYGAMRSGRLLWREEAHVALGALPCAFGDSPLLLAVAARVSTPHAAVVFAEAERLIGSGELLDAPELVDADPHLAAAVAAATGRAADLAAIADREPAPPRSHLCVGLGDALRSLVDAHGALDPDPADEVDRRARDPLVDAAAACAGSAAAAAKWWAAADAEDLMARAHPLARPLLALFLLRAAVASGVSALRDGPALAALVPDACQAHGLQICVPETLCRCAFELRPLVDSGRVRRSPVVVALPEGNAPADAASRFGDAAVREAVFALENGYVADGRAARLAQAEILARVASEPPNP